LIRYKLGITPKEILFVDHAKGKEKRERRYEMRIELRARARVHASLQVKPILQAESSQVKPGCAGCNCDAGSGRSARKGLPSSLYLLFQ